MKLVAYVLDGHHVEIRPAPIERDWMESTNQRYAYRCLPLNIANTFGWEILSNAGFTATWNGSGAIDCIDVVPDPGMAAPAISHFGHGILTFHLPVLFRTDAGDNLLVQGPVNRPKDGIAALSGIIETDWSPYSFTMNWLFTRPDYPVRFEKGEPFCHILPVNCGAVENIEPELRRLSEEPELKRLHELWTTSRLKFNVDLKEPGSDAQSEKWQKLYYRGLDPEGRAAPLKEHRTRLKVKPFRSGNEPPGRS
jgi:hypothetical protein